MTLDATLRVRLAQLAAFLPVFEPPSSDYGRWNAVGHTRDGVLLPTFEFNDTVRAFARHLHEQGWVRTDDEWSRDRGVETAMLRRNPRAVDTATVDQLELLLTSLMSQPPFSAEGLIEGIESGLVARILRRAAVLAS